MERIDKCNIIPVVKKCHSFGQKIRILPCIYTEKKEFYPLIKVCCEYTKKVLGKVFREEPGGVCLILDEKLERESYVIRVDDEVKIWASDYQGCAYGLATLLQLMDDKMEVEKVQIEDKPDKDYRGLMIDLARKWHPFPKLLHYVDICFFYKVKYLHLHFMDDQSYTLPSAVYPKLSLLERSYSFDEIRKLCSYAKERGVVLVPEIEMPGHAKSLVETYPDLFANCYDTEESEILITEDGDTFKRESVVCAGSMRVFENITRLIDEVMDLFPDSPYIHLGADEVNTSSWKNCPMCREYMKQKGIDDTQELYTDFVARATDYVLKKGRRPIVWEGFSKEYSHKISKEVIVIGWECHYQNPDDLISGGFEVINCSWRPLYITSKRLMAKPGLWNETDILKWNVYEWQHWWEKSDATLNPFHLQPTEQIIGAQLCEWEMTYECGIATIIIRLAALSERTWSVKRFCSDEEFWAKLAMQMDKAFRMIAVDD